jgi:nitronate monooxygenase
MKTRFTEKWHGRETELAEPAVVERETERYLDASSRGDVDNTGVFVGEAVALIRDIRPAGAILRQIVAEAEELLGRKAPSLLTAR